MSRRGAIWLLLGVLGLYALLRALGSRSTEAPPADSWTRVDDQPAPPRTPDPPDPWIEAQNGACPVSHPVKGKLSSSIFHVPGGASYERTRADRCYLDAGAAEAAGLRAAKR